jgi:hypothetical protein
VLATSKSSVEVAAKLRSQIRSCCSASKKLLLHVWKSAVTHHRRGN